MEKVVHRTDLEERLAHIISLNKNPDHGIFGPESMMWKIGKENIAFLGAGRAVLLQLAHPWVSSAIEHHGKVQTDPIGRFYRTFDSVLSMIFGDLPSAIKAARNVHNIHKKINGVTETGESYSANQQDALLWVHSTLWETSIKTYELIIGKISKEEKEEYYQETKFFAYLFGITDEVLPKTWDDFCAYNELMHNGENKQLYVQKAAIGILESIFAPNNSLKIPASVYRSFTANMMPENLRKQFGIPYGAKEKLLFNTSIPAIKIYYKFLPKQIRYNPAYNSALKRIK